MADANTQQEPRAPDDGDTNETRQGKLRQENDVKEILATNIVRYRQRLGLSRAALAKKIGVTEAAIGQYERGTRTPQIDIICKISNAMNVPIDVLVEHEPGTFSAVIEYRFDKAVEYFQYFNAYVFESEDGKVSIQQRTETRPDFYQAENGVVSLTPQEKITVLATFADRKTFITWFEDVFHEVIFNKEIKKMIDESLSNLGNYFIPNLQIRYLGEKSPF